MLRRALRTLPVPREGVTALVGPAGAGKTSSIAKITADFVRNGKADDIALITTDTTRIAAEEQLRIYGNIFRVPVHAASNAHEAAHLINMLSNKRYLLIDTEGVGIRDTAGLERLQSLFGALPDMDVFLTLPADRDQHTQWEITQRFRQALPLNGIVATNLDQCVRLGALMSVLIQSRLPAVWFSDGTRIPGNLKAAESKWIIAEAIRLAREFKRSQPMGDSDFGSRREAVA
nr:AAA family ATPase [Litorivivens lipolytica]